MKKILSTLLVFSVAITTGCSAFRPHTQTVNISCNPPESVLTVNGQRHQSPAQIETPRNRDLSVQCNKAGYHPAQRTIGHHFNGTGALDTAGIFLFLLPGIGLFTPGAWSLDQTDVQMQLFEEK